MGGTAFSGNIARHRDFLLYEQPAFTSGFEIEFLTKKDTSSSWQRFWRLPDITHHFHFNYLGNREELGSALAYYPSINFKLWGNKKFTGYCQIGNGIAYLTNPYDINRNPSNNAIGSHWNSMIVLKLEAKVKIRESIFLNFGPQIFHYSNGSAKAPNIGINNVVFGLGLKYQISEPPIYVNGPVYNSTTRWKRWNYEFNTGIGFRQINIPNSLNYRVPQFNLFVHYHFYEFFRLVGGFSYEYNYASYHFAKTQFENEESARLKARDYQVKISTDFIFGNLFSRFQVGFYLPIEDKEVAAPLSTMFSLNYARKISNRNKHKMFVGIGVRSHKFVAQYLSINIGFIL